MGSIPAAPSWSAARANQNDLGKPSFEHTRFGLLLSKVRGQPPSLPPVEPIGQHKRSGTKAQTTNACIRPNAHRARLIAIAILSCQACQQGVRNSLQKHSANSSARRTRQPWPFAVSPTPLTTHAMILNPRPNTSAIEHHRCSPLSQSARGKKPCKPKKNT